MTDQEIIDGLRNRGRQAAEILLDRFERPLIRYFQVALPDPQSAPDAAQEVFLRLIHTIQESKKLEVRSLQSYLFTIARRLAIDQVRESHRRPVIASLDEPEGSGSEGDSRTLMDRIPDHHPGPRETAERQERTRIVREAIRALDPELREVTFLHHIEGLPGREIALLLHIEEGTVWSRLHRSLQILRRTLAPNSNHAQASQPDAPKDARRQP